MRYLPLFALLFFFSACNKDKFTTAPQIKFKSISPSDFASNVVINLKDQAPKLTVHVTDAEGDIGMVPNVDTAKIFIKNLLTNRLDSFDLPDLAGAGGKNFKADIEVNLYQNLGCRSVGPPRPRTDTIYFEVYVRDFAKNKSNVIVTDDPVYYRCL